MQVLFNEVLQTEIEEDILRIAQLLEFLVIHINSFTEEQTKSFEEMIDKLSEYDVIEDFSFVTKLYSFNDVLEVIKKCKANEK